MKQVPVLEYVDQNGNPKILVQSNAIARTCARWCGLAGKTAQEMEQADEAQEWYFNFNFLLDKFTLKLISLREIADSSSKVMWEFDQEKKDKLAANMKTDVIPRMLGYLENRMDNDNSFVAGGESVSHFSSF